MLRIAVMLLTVFVLLGTVPGCERDSSSVQEKISAAPIGHAECAACGMTVGHQPAPRAQVVHNDGTRAFLCSISDLVHYRSVPSAHGRIVETFVEVMEAGADPGESDTDERPWIKADEARYVIGVERPLIMGPPALTYRDGDTAAAVASEHSGTVLSWSALTEQLHQ